MTTIEQQIEDESFKQYEELAACFAAKDMAFNENDFTAGFELGAQWAMRWWAERWQKSAKTAQGNYLLLCDEMDAAAAEILEGGK